MASPFKMKPKTPMMKALVGKQGNLPQHLKEKILAAPETAKKGSPAKSYGSPMKKTDNKFAEAKVGMDEGKTTTKSIGKGRTLEVKKRTVKKIVAPKKADEMSAGERKDARTMAARRGGGRLGTETTKKVSQKGVKGNKKTSTAYAGTKTDKSGRTKYRTLSDGSKVVVEGTVSAIKPRGIDGKKKKDAKGKSPAKSYGSKKKSPMMKKGVKGLKMQRGKK
jgi:hypothetical protein